MSSINLSKGQKIELKKQDGSSLQRVFMGLGWDPVGSSSGGILKGLFGGSSSSSSIDLDASCVMLDANKSEVDVVYFGKLYSTDGSVRHSGDNLTGAGDGDDETINVDFSKLEPEAEEIVFVVTIYEAQARAQNFGQVSNAFVRVYNPDTKQEYARYDLGEDFSLETGVEFCRLYKKDGEWKINAVGQGKRGGLQDYLNEF